MYIKLVEKIMDATPPAPPSHVQGLPNPQLLWELMDYGWLFCLLQVDVHWMSLSSLKAFAHVMQGPNSSVESTSRVHLTSSLNAFEFTWHEALGEAEAELAKLNILGILDAVVLDNSNDSVQGCSSDIAHKIAHYGLEMVVTKMSSVWTAVAIQALCQLTPPEDNIFECGPSDIHIVTSHLRSTPAHPLAVYQVTVPNTLLHAATLSGITVEGTMVLKPLITSHCIHVMEIPACIVNYIALHLSQSTLVGHKIMLTSMSLKKEKEDVMSEQENMLDLTVLEDAGVQPGCFKYHADHNAVIDLTKNNQYLVTFVLNFAKGVTQQITCHTRVIQEDQEAAAKPGEFVTKSHPSH
ncbi:hypothetical protein V8B97DRAFT_1915797 [Scleroderma yunnanense]